MAKKKDKRTNDDLQNVTHKTKDRATRNPLKAGDELRFSGRVNSSCSSSDTHRLTLVTNNGEFTRLVMALHAVLVDLLYKYDLYIVIPI